VKGCAAFWTRPGSTSAGCSTGTRW
jgi:hypothetical protein